MPDDTPMECGECGLRYGVIWNLDALGGWEGGYCPRCGFYDIIVHEEEEEPE